MLTSHYIGTRRPAWITWKTRNTCMCQIVEQINFDLLFYFSRVHLEGKVDLEDKEEVEQQVCLDLMAHKVQLVKLDILEDVDHLVLLELPVNKEQLVMMVLLDFLGALELQVLREREVIQDLKDLQDLRYIIYMTNT